MTSREVSWGCLAARVAMLATTDIGVRDRVNALVRNQFDHRFLSSTIGMPWVRDSHVTTPWIH
jgi:hypothetical protein